MELVSDSKEIKYSTQSRMTDNVSPSPHRQGVNRPDKILFRDLHFQVSKYLTNLRTERLKEFYFQKEKKNINLTQPYLNPRTLGLKVNTSLLQHRGRQNRYLNIPLILKLENFLVTFTQRIDLTRISS